MASGTPSKLHAAIFRIGEDQPVYHRPIHGVLPFACVCGRKLGDGKPLLPAKHARKIGKPCKGCYPGGRA